MNDEELPYDFIGPNRNDPEDGNEDEDNGIKLRRALKDAFFQVMP